MVLDVAIQIALGLSFGLALAIPGWPVQNGPMIVETSPRTRASRSRQPRAKWPIVVVVMAVVLAIGAAWLVIPH